MKKIIKKTINFQIEVFIRFLHSFRLGRYLIEIIEKKIKMIKCDVNYNGNLYRFYTPNRLNFFRAKTFLSKEPETIDWIKTFKDESIFWDIGANVGLYTCFASKEKKVTTYAFEPSLFNLEILAKNIYLNDLSEKVIIIPLSLTDKLKLSNFNMSNTDEGGSMSTFSENYTHTGKSFNINFRYKTLGVSGDDLVKKLNLENPHYIKIDVDGIEHLILKGFGEVLEHARSILIEVNDNFELQRKNVYEILKNKGFILENKKQSEMIASSEYNSNVYNQIWNKKN